MRAFLFQTGVVLLLTKIVAAQECGDCRSYGIDFLHDGFCFQNSESFDTFTALQEFEGCRNDTANNIFVHPNGDQYECSISQLQPDDTPQLVTCPISKNEMFSGDWSLLIISNNGNCEPIAYQRDFELSVGPQQTLTVSPTIVVSTTTTPIVTVVQTVTQVITQTARPSTTIVPRATLKPTVTKHPLTSITIVTKARYTVTKVQQIVNVLSTQFETVTPACRPTVKDRVADPIARIEPTVLQDAELVQRDAARVAMTHPVTSKCSRAIPTERVIQAEGKARFLRERRQRLRLRKRFPDQPVVTVTGSNGDVVTSVATLTALPTTITGTSVVPSTITTTPTITVSRGVFVTVVTATAPRKTITLTNWRPVTSVSVTETRDVVLTITESSVPATASASCAAVGGTLA